MAGRDFLAADGGFVPFEPRRHRKANAHLEEPPSIAPGEERAESQPDGAPTWATAGEEEAEPLTSHAASPCATSAQASATDNTALETSTGQEAGLEPKMREPQPPAATSPCDHALAIRHEAIRLAAIACGRALRHAVVLHPQTIAAFVDDALAAAGNPRHARVRLHPDVVGTQHDGGHEWIWDAGLERGDVIVECDDVVLRADLQSRAALLVRAAAER